MRGNYTIGTWVSGVGHLFLISWLLLGWGLSHEPLDFDVTEVTVVTGEEYAAMVAATSPQALTDVIPAPEAPPVEDQPAPQPAPAEETPLPPPPPDPVQPPTEDSPPPPAPAPVPTPAEVTDVAPEMPQPEPPAPPAAAPDLTASLRPVPRPAPRVAPEAVAPPPPEADIAPEVSQEATPEAEAPEVVEEPAEAAAPEEATTEIVTEAEVPSGAVTRSLRPQSRPARPTPPAPRIEPEVQTASSDNVAQPATDPVTDAVADAVAAAVAEAAAAATAPAATTNPGPPMTGAERDAFSVAVKGCWVVDPGSQAAQVTVTLVFELDRSGRVAGDVTMLTNTGGPEGAVRSAFDAARRAVLRCQGDGFPLPAEKYEQWRVVEMTFNPEQMRIR